MLQVWAAFTRFLDDGFVCLSNSTAKLNNIDPQA